MSSRRDFAKKMFATGLASSALARSAPGQASPSDTINIGVVGFRGRGSAHYNAFARIPGVRVAYLCDVDERLFAPAVAEIEKIGGYRPQTETDIRKLLEKQDLDAISIATPDHWHALMTIWGCQAGKDVYVEKPCSYTLWEGRKMVEAARKYNRIVQVGLNRRSSARTRAAMEFVRQNQFGKTYRAKAVIYRGRASIGRVQEASIPQGVNWDLFLGPAPYRAFSLNRFHYGWHFFSDTSTHEMGNNGVHALDVVRWGLAKNVHPVRIHCTGGQFGEKSDSEVPDVQVGTFEYEDGTLVEVDTTTLYSPPFGGVRMGEFFYTDRGYISPEDRWKTVEGKFTPRDEPDLPGGVSLRASNLSFPRIAYADGPPIPDTGEEDEASEERGSHFTNFIDCVRSRNRDNLHCEIEEGHLSTSLCHLANIAYRTKRTLVFDPKTETFPGDDEVNGLLRRTYREPYVVPENV
jgi:predicted dehydrogenase